MVECLFANHVLVLDPHIAYESLLQDCYDMSDETEWGFALSELKQGKVALKQHFIENYKNVSQDSNYELRTETASSTSDSPQKTTQRGRGPGRESE